MNRCVICPACSRPVPELSINRHLDNSCADLGSPSKSTQDINPRAGQSQNKPKAVLGPIAPIFKMKNTKTELLSQPIPSDHPRYRKRCAADDRALSPGPPMKRSRAENLHAAAPLAERLRPKNLAEFVGQPHLTGASSLLMTTLAKGSVGSLIFWGPPGCGKTTLARLLAQRSDSVFKELSATTVGINDVRTVLEEAKGTLSKTGRKTILFLDEVHRFNKAQQDIFLPFLEQGHVQLIGATTENPSFKLTSALLSRCRVFVLERLTDDDIKVILTVAVERESLWAAGDSRVAEASSSQPQYPLSETSQSKSSSVTNMPYPPFPQLTSRVVSTIISLAAGDARTALSLLDLAMTSLTDSEEEQLLSSLRQSVSVFYDRTGDNHYDMISALHKSVRGSQGSAAMYWLARMLCGGEDPLYIARRMIVCASEDIGLADSHALPLAVATLQACQAVGMPECRINLAHLVAYLSEAPKSTRAYEAYNRAENAAKLNLTIPVPMQMRNAPTKLTKELGFGLGYCYNPAYVHPVHNDYLPMQFIGDAFLREAGDRSGKTWDEDALRRWEDEANGGKEWDGRKNGTDQ